MGSTRAPLLLTLCTVALLAGMPGGGHAAPAPMASLLEQARIQPLSPPVPAPDFRLPTLAGSELSLSDNPGRWVLLTFFATWCGPCKTEMPGLQRFHEKYSSRGFDVFGVSTDSSIGVVKPFARSFKLTFPIGVDTQGKAASLYQASSIPVSYLITPEGTIAGVVRGARDWTRLDALVDGLLLAIPPKPDAQPAFASNATPVTLPTVLSPPTADYTASASSVTVGEALTLDVRITWAGHFKDYLLHPPKVPLPEGLEQRSMTAHTSSEEGRKVVRYRFTFDTTTPGNFALDPIELRYTPRFENEPIASRVAGPTLTVTPSTRIRDALIVLGSLLGLGLLGGLWRWRARSRPASGLPLPGSDTALALNDLLRESRSLRHQGDIAGYLHRLAALNQQLGTPEDITGILNDLLPRVEFGGYRPSPQELDSLHRRIEVKVSGRPPAQTAPEQDLLSQTQHQEGVKS